MGIGAILGLLAAIVPVVLLWLQRKWKRENSPEAQRERIRREIDEILASDDQSGLNEFLHERLRDDKNRIHSDPGRSGGDKGEGE